MGATQRVFKDVTLAPADGAERKPLRYIKPKELAASNTRGLVLEGIYKGTTPSNADPDKNDFKFETETELIVLNSSGMLAKKMQQVAENDVVQILYNGQEPIKSGKMAGRLAHCFDVKVLAE